MLGKCTIGFYVLAAGPRSQGQLLTQDKQIPCMAVDTCLFSPPSDSHHLLVVNDIIMATLRWRPVPDWSFDFSSVQRRYLTLKHIYFLLHY
jgi:hypothetical protein